MFTIVVKYKPDIMPLWKEAAYSKKEITWNCRLHSYKRKTCLHNYNRVMCIMHCRKYHLHNCNRNSHLHNYNKNCQPHLCCRNCHLHICSKNSKLHNCNRNSHLLNYNRKIHLHTSNKDYHFKTCINARDVTWIIAIESVSGIVPTETSTCRIDHRNFNLQKWCQSEIRLVTIKKLSKWVSTKFKANSFSTPCIT